MPSASTYTIAIFGLIASSAGLYGLVNPAGLVKSSGIRWIESSSRPDTDLTIFYQTGSSLAALNVGVYYMLAAYSGWHRFYVFTVPFRFLTAYVVAYRIHCGEVDQKLGGLVWFEGLGALVTLVALVLERPGSGDKKRV